MKLTSTIFSGIACAAALLFLDCSNPSSGNGSDVGNPSLVGIVYNQDGSRAINAKVKFIPSHYDPIADSAAPVIDSAVTNDTGGYKIDSLPADTFNLLANLGNFSGYEDSIAIKAKSLTVAPPCTLKATGSVTGVVQLQPGDNATNVFILFMGTKTWDKPSDSIGNFTISGLAQGRYAVKILTTLPNYDDMDTSFSIRAGVDSILPSPLKLHYTGIPVPQGLRIEYDTMKQIVTLIWNKPTSGTVVQGYNIYRKHQDSASFERIKSGVADTTYNDSTGIQDITYEYRVATVDTGANEGVKSGTVSVAIVSYFVLDTMFNKTGTGQGQFDYPSDIAITANGDIFIVDQNNNRIQTFDSSMSYKREFRNNIFNRPYRIAVNNKGYVFVAACNTYDTILVFDTTGSLMDTLSIKGIFDLSATDSELYVITDGDSILVYSIYGLKKREWGCGDFNSCNWVTAEDSGKIFISNSQQGIIVYDSLGGWLSTAIIPYCTYPYSIAINETTHRLYTICLNSRSGNILHVTDVNNMEVANYKINSQPAEHISIGLQQNGTVFIVLAASNKILKLKPLLP